MRSIPRDARIPVWALPRSLAATYGIDVSFFPYVMDWRMDDRGSLCRVSPFRHLRIVEYLLLPGAFRSLSRLSSALSAKASALRPFCLTICQVC